MKKGIFTALLFTVIVALYSLYLANGKCVYKSNISSLLLENIEALAADEDGSDDGEVVGGKIRCIDVGFYTKKNEYCNDQNYNDICHD